MVVAVRDGAFVLEVDNCKYVALMDWLQSLNRVKWVDVAHEAELALSNMPSPIVFFGSIHTCLRSLEITPWERSCTGICRTNRRLLQHLRSMNSKRMFRER